MKAVNRFLKILRSVGLVLLGLVLLLCGIVGVARLLNLRDFRITSETGIEEHTFLELGGIEQFVQIRGECTSNPVIIAVHGGPANPLPHLAYQFQRELEKDYTIVHWDQRGSGRTYFKNTGVEQPDTSLELILSDMDQLVDYARERFSQDQVIVMGQSWGTIVGIHYVQRNPEKVSTFVSVSQVVSVLEGIELMADKALARAEQAGNQRDVQELAGLIEKLQTVTDYSPELMRNFIRITTLTLRYLPYEYQQSIPRYAWNSATSPTISLTDLRWFLTIAQIERFEQIQSSILQTCFTFDARTQAPTLDVPVHFIVGSDDWITPATLTEAYFEAIDAPHKTLTILEGAGHSPDLEIPNQFQQAVIAALE